MTSQKRSRSVGRPMKGKSKRVRVSFTVSPDKLAWLKSHARIAKQNNSETIEAALSHYQRLCGVENSPLRTLCARYPSIFWDIEPGTVEEATHSDFVIEKVLEHGSLASVKDLFLIFAPDRIAEVIKRSRRISRRTARFWAVRMRIAKGIRCLEEESPNQLSKPWQH